ncbi:transcriptional regulator with XRE-family HTH domain [Actinoplanes tereljensis]|uniref:Transcriptional regulator n=1 Tax=Paractinoplanes tereljensis TaxID=571912 RepID=A0A919TRL9_9ACTN|nr:helix-turn-helix transcriptional regulator [Actinoplanes tereljensis]GIF20433.1 transcriptional regulator [Actinoplanes tereljensis]
MPRAEGPTLRRRRLGAELRRCREAAKLTQEQVSQRFEWHPAKVTRIETAKVSVTPRDVRDLLDMYGVDDREYRDSLVDMARSSREQSWWTQYRDILPPDSFVGFEAEAAAIRSWEPVVLPGLLQTEAYMRALFAVSLSAERLVLIDRITSLRLARQRRLREDPPLKLFAIVDESVIRRPIGGRQVMAEQLRHLLAVSELPTVTLRVLPYDAGEHALLGVSIAILEFPGGADPDIVYVEGPIRSRQFVRQPAEVGQYRDVFAQLSRRCLDQQSTTVMIKSVLAA